MNRNWKDKATSHTNVNNSLTFKTLIHFLPLVRVGITVTAGWEGQKIKGSSWRIHRWSETNWEISPAGLGFAPRSSPSGMCLFSSGSLTGVIPVRNHHNWLHTIWRTSGSAQRSKNCPRSKDCQAPHPMTKPKPSIPAFSRHPFSGTLDWPVNINFQPQTEFLLHQHKSVFEAVTLLPLTKSVSITSD